MAFDQPILPYSRRIGPKVGVNAIMSGNARFVILEERGLIEVSGADRVAFLQGLVSNDVEKVSPERALYAALLTPQGKYLHDFFVYGSGGAFLLDCERGRLADLQKRLGIYKLRADVALADRSDDFAVAAVFGDSAAQALGLAEEAGTAAAFAGGIACVDPRLAAAGVRVVLPRDDAAQALAGAGLEAADAADYDRFRLALGLPDGSRDMVTEKSILLESGFEELNGVDWDKGCYMGQELTARTKYRGLVKKRLVPVALAGPPPEPGTPIIAGGRAAGELRSAIATEAGAIGLALMRLDALDEGGLAAAGVAVTPRKPDWAQF